MGLFGKPKQPLGNEDQQLVVDAIKRAEANTTGEIRVFMEPHCTYVDAMERAKEIFANLEMHKTVKRNAVLVYLAHVDHQFAIFGDKEIYEQAGGAEFWKEAARHLLAYLKEGKMGEGLAKCVDELGEALAKHFPYDPAVTKNELPDEIVFGK